MAQQVPSEELHFISAVTAQGIGGGTTALMTLLRGLNGRPVKLHYSSLARSVWGGFASERVDHVVHEGWKTYENRGYAFYDDSHLAFDAGRIPEDAPVVFDSIEAVRQLAETLHQRGCRLYWHVHSPHRFLRKSPRDTARDLVRIRRLRRAIFVSEFLRRNFRSSLLNLPFRVLAPLDSTVVYTGIEGNPSGRPIPAASDHVVYFGRYDGYKDPLFVEQCFGERVRYVGTARGCRHPVAVPPERDLGWMSADEAAGLGDIFVFPARDEAFGLAIVEMMLRGKIVICARSGAFPEIVTHGEDGFLVAPGDRAAARAIVERLDRDSALRERVRANALASARRFGVQQYRERFLAALC